MKIEFIKEIKGILNGICDESNVLEINIEQNEDFEKYIFIVDFLPAWRIDNLYKFVKKQGFQYYINPTFHLEDRKHRLALKVTITKPLI